MEILLNDQNKADEERNVSAGKQADDQKQVEIPPVGQISNTQKTDNKDKNN